MFAFVHVMYTVGELNKDGNAGGCMCVSVGGGGGGLGSGGIKPKRDEILGCCVLMGV